LSVNHQFSVSVGGIGSGLSGGLSLFGGWGVFWSGLFSVFSLFFLSILQLINTTTPRNKTIEIAQKSTFLKNLDIVFIK